MLSLCKEESLRVSTGTVLITHTGSTRPHQDDLGSYTSSSIHVNAIQYLKKTATPTSSSVVGRSKNTALHLSTYWMSKFLHHGYTNSEYNKITTVNAQVPSRQRTENTRRFQFIAHKRNQDKMTTKITKSWPDVISTSSSQSSRLFSRRRKVRESGIQCSCTIRAIENTPMSVQVKFFRLESQAQQENSISDGSEPMNVRYDANGVRVRCPKLSLVYDGSMVQPLACPGLESKAVTSYQLPPIKLSQLGVDLIRGMDDGNAYYAGFIINVTATGEVNTRLETSCNKQANKDQNVNDDNNSSNGADNQNNADNEIDGDKADIISPTTIDSVLASIPPVLNNNDYKGKSTRETNTGDTPSEPQSMITMVIPTAEDRNSGANGDVHKTASVDEPNPLLNGTNGNDTIVLTSSPPLQSLSTPWPAVTESRAALLQTSGELNQDDDDSSGIVLVAVLTSLIVASILCGIGFCLWRIRRLRNDARNDQPPLNHCTRPYHVASLSHWLHRHLSQGHRGSAVNTSHLSPHSQQVNDTRGPTDENALYAGSGHGDIINHRCDDDMIQTDGVNHPLGTTPHGDSQDSSYLTGSNIIKSGYLAGMNNSLSFTGYQEEITETNNSYSAILSIPAVPSGKREKIVNSKRKNEQQDDNKKIKERDKREEGVKNGMDCFHSTHNVLPLSGIRIPNSKQTQLAITKCDGEENSGGKYSMARETTNTETRSLGQSVIHFLSNPVFGKVLPRRMTQGRSCGDENYKKINGVWKQIDVDQTFEESSSDGYETYMAKSGMSNSDSCYYRSLGSCDNYEVAKVYGQHDTKQNNDRNESSYGGHGKIVLGTESGSDGYDNFVVCKGCRTPQMPSLKNEMGLKPNIKLNLNIKDAGMSYNGAHDCSEGIYHGENTSENDDTSNPHGNKDRREFNILQSTNILTKYVKNVSTVRYAEPKSKAFRYPKKTTNIIQKDTKNNKGQDNFELNPRGTETDRNNKTFRSNDANLSTMNYGDALQLKKHINKNQTKPPRSKQQSQKVDRNDTQQLSNCEDLVLEQAPPLPARNHKRNKMTPVPRNKNQTTSLECKKLANEDQGISDDIANGNMTNERNCAPEFQDNYHVPKPKRRFTKYDVPTQETYKVRQANEQNDQSEC